MSTYTQHARSSLEYIRPTARDVFRGLLGAIELEPRPALPLIYTVPVPDINTDKVPRPPNSFILFKSWISKGFGREEACISDELWQELILANSKTVAHFNHLAREAKSEHLARFPRYKYRPQKKGQRKPTQQHHGEEEGSVNVEERTASGGEEDAIRLKDPSQSYQYDQQDRTLNIDIHPMTHSDVERVKASVANQHISYTLPGPSASMTGQVTSNRSYEDARWPDSSMLLGTINPIYIVHTHSRDSEELQPYGFLGFPDLYYSRGPSPSVESPESEPPASFTNSLLMRNDRGTLVPLSAEFQIIPPAGEWGPQELPQMIFEI